MFVSSQQLFKVMQSNIIYKRTLDSLRAEIEAHVCPKSGKASMKAFCEEYGINRPNLATVLGDKSEMSVALFVRICEALGKLVQGRVPHDVKQLDRIPCAATWPWTTPPLPKPCLRFTWRQARRLSRQPVQGRSRVLAQLSGQAKSQSGSPPGCRIRDTGKAGRRIRKCSSL
jgi:hypothetical protein